MVDRKRYFRRPEHTDIFKQMNMITAIIFTTKDIAPCHFRHHAFFYDGDMAGCTIFSIPFAPRKLN